MSQSDSQKNGWVRPRVQKFGEEKGAAKKASDMFGAECGESVIRYGPECRIRTGNKCRGRLGNSCKDRNSFPCKETDVFDEETGVDSGIPPQQ